jgi:hypothetical protein
VPLLVHGIVSAGSLTQGDLSDAAEVDVAIVTHAELAGIVTPTDEEEAMPSRANLLRHTGVLEAATETTTVLPMRFGVVVPDEDTLVREYLEPEQSHLLDTLTRLDGHVEIRLRGRYDEESAIRVVVASDRRAARLRGRRGMEAKMELGERIVAGLEALREQHLQQAVDALMPPAAEAVPGRVAEPLDAFAVSFLVDHDELEHFDREVEQLADRLAPVVELKLIGPLPPFSFAGTGGS